LWEIFLNDGKGTNLFIMCSRKWMIKIHVYVCLGERGGGGSIILMFSSEERIYQVVNVDNHFSTSNFTPFPTDLTLATNTTVVE
jgi:hypothetical protein